MGGGMHGCVCENMMCRKWLCRKVKKVSASTAEFWATNVAWKSWPNNRILAACNRGGGWDNIYQLIAHTIRFIQQVVFERQVHKTCQKTTTTITTAKNGLLSSLHCCQAVKASCNTHIFTVFNKQSTRRSPQNWSHTWTYIFSSVSLTAACISLFWYFNSVQPLFTRVNRH